MIPITKPTLPPYHTVEEEIRDVFTTGMITNDKYVRRFEEKAAQYLGVKYTIGAPSCTAGLTALLSTLKEETEVIIPAFTFSATYQAVIWNNLVPVLVDCDESCNIAVDQVEGAVTSKTSAILAVHMYGTPADIDGLTRIARARGLSLFFDAAHGFGSRYRGKPVGGFGDAEVFSLGPTKTLPVGEGGLITTNSKELAERVRLACEHGHHVGSLDCEVKGFNGRLEEINAIIGIHVLDQLDGMVQRRSELEKRYKTQLSEVPGISFPHVPDYVVSTFKDMAIFIDRDAMGLDRNELAAYLEQRGIATKFYFWPPIHQLAICKSQYAHLRFPNTERKSESVLSLPMYSHMPYEEVDYVCQSIEDAHQEAMKTPSPGTRR